jgi:hypothetical protein
MRRIPFYEQAMLSLFQKKKEWKRLASKSVTETLARAMECADDMDLVVVIYQTKEGCKSPGGVFIQEDTTFSSINWMLDQAKRWILE